MKKIETDLGLNFRIEKIGAKKLGIQLKIWIVNVKGFNKDK